MVLFINRSNERIVFSAAGHDVVIGRNGRCSAPDEVALEFFSAAFSRPGLRRFIKVFNADGSNFDPKTVKLNTPETEETKTEEPSVAEKPDESVSTEEQSSEKYSEEPPAKIITPTLTTKRKQSGKSGKTVKVQVKP